MSSPEKGMSSELASLKKIAGHVTEEDYAELIGGRVNPADPSKKKDVLDRLGRTHSVKSGKKWQIFLYSRSRLDSNTVLRGFGNIAPHMIDCIDSLPATRDEREADPNAAKAALQGPMRALAEELKKPGLLEAFFLKAAFEAGEVEFWALMPSGIDQTKVPIKEKKFHVFDSKEAVRAICRDLDVANSKARGKGQTDAQKVVFRDQVNIGEIELRTDPKHYGEMKMWLDSGRVIPLLMERIPISGQPFPQITAHGRAHRLKP